MGFYRWPGLDQKLTGRLVGMRKARRVGTFPIFPGSLMLRRAKRLRQVIKEQGLKKIFSKLYAFKSD
jgi:hypothetical protein